MSQTAYLVSCDVLCGEGSDGAQDGLDSAYVLVAVNASSEEQAMEKIETAFEEDGYDLIEAEWICAASEMEWSDAEAEAEGKDILARLATIPDEVVYGQLYDSSEDDVSEAA